MKDEDGDVYHVEDASRLSNGDPIWSKTQVLTFPNFFYRDQFMLDSVIIAGLSIDQIDNIYTEERMVLYNQTHPESQLSKSVVDHPLAYIHHVSKHCQTANLTMQQLTILYVHSLAIIICCESFS